MISFKNIFKSNKPKKPEDDFGWKVFYQWKEVERSSLSDDQKRKYREWIKEHHANIRREEKKKEMEQQYNVRSWTEQQFVNTVFWWEVKEDVSSRILAEIIIFPYRVLAWFIHFLWILLIPYRSIRDYTKEIFPVAFALWILMIMMFNWIYISIWNIDTILFEDNFFPFLWWIPQVILVLMLLFSIYRTYQKISSKESWDWWTEHFSNKTWKWIVVSLFIFLFVWLPFLFVLWERDLSLSLISITWSSLFWYACYLIYLFVVATSLYTIFKTSLYAIFSLMNKEFNTFQRQMKEVVWALIIILFLNGFLSISFILL